MTHLMDAQKVQAGLLVVYVGLAILFIKQKQYAPAIYYIGCVVKDAAVFIMAMLA